MATEEEQWYEIVRQAVLAYKLARVNEELKKSIYALQAPQIMADTVRSTQAANRYRNLTELKRRMECILYS